MGQLTQRPANHLQVGDTVRLPNGDTQDLMQVSRYAVGQLLLTWADRTTTITLPNGLFDVV